MSELPRGTVTLFFADIEGSTRLLRQLGHESYGSLLSDYRRMLRQAMERRGGREIDVEGDACFFAFRRAKDGVLAAADAQRALADHRWPGVDTLQVRIGLHTGEPSVADVGYLGLAVHRAARICAAGRGAQVLLSHTTRALLEDEPSSDIRLRDLGEQRLKDFDDPERLYQLVIHGLREESPALRGLDSQPVKATPFAGQERILAAAVHAAVGTTRSTKLLERWRLLVSRLRVRLGGRFPLYRQALLRSATKPRTLIVLGAILSAALLVDPWVAALALAATIAVFWSSTIRQVRASHDLEAIGWHVHAMARIAPSEQLRGHVARLGAAISRMGRSARDVDRLLTNVDRGTLAHRLHRSRERSTVSPQALAAADATAAQIAALDRMTASRNALRAERESMENRIHAISEEIFEARLDESAREALAAEIRSIHEVVSSLSANLELAYDSAKRSGLATERTSARLKAARS